MTIDIKHGIHITERDRLMSAWLNSMELVRDYERFAKEMEGSPLAKVFYEYAEEEGRHASKFRDLLLKYEENT